MGSLSVALLIGSIVIILCILFNKISNKAGIPMLLGFILLGMMFGSDGIVKIKFENFKFAEDICSISLIFIMFYGGFGTKWDEAKSVAGKSLLLSSLGVIITAIVTGIFCYFVLRLPFLEGMLIGSVLGCTDAASVFSILRSKNLNLKDGTASILEMESGSNDPFAYMMTIMVLYLMSGTASFFDMAILTISQLFLGILCGVIVAYIGEQFLRKIEMDVDGFEAIFVFAIAILGYALPTIINGNGYLSVYIVGIYLGNSKKIPNKKELVNFFNGVTSLMQVLIFFILGLLAFPSQLPIIFPLAVAIALFLTFIGRPVATFLILWPFRKKKIFIDGTEELKKVRRAERNQKILISWSGLRGASSIVFAILAVVSDIDIQHDIFHIVFTVVLLSITFQGTLIPLIARWFDMIDTNSDVMRTFNDYTEENEIQFIKIRVDKESKWANSLIREISLPPNTMIAMINRKKTQKNKNSALTDENSIDNKRCNISENHKWYLKSYYYMKKCLFKFINIFIVIFENIKTIINKIKTIFKTFKIFRKKLIKTLKEVKLFKTKLKQREEESENNHVQNIDNSNNNPDKNVKKDDYSTISCISLFIHFWNKSSEKKRRTVVERIPNGSTMILPGDEVILCAEGYNDANKSHLIKELKVKENYEYVGKELSELNLSVNTLILVIRREGRIIIPTGDTVILSGDTLIMRESKENKK
ncbi:potassium/proton antiporter [Fusobacterium sp. PH5-44]|uniref:potassium/proton antiporter n=1 Tax=unclassified Fusobacterium TaxID=2648384 RepID=UPI003D1F450C